MENLHVNVVRNCSFEPYDATIPVQVNDSKAGWDLHSACDCVLPPNARLLHAGTCINEDLNWFGVEVDFG